MFELLVHIYKYVQLNRFIVNGNDTDIVAMYLHCSTRVRKPDTFDTRGSYMRYHVHEEVPCIFQ